MRAPRFGRRILGKGIEEEELESEVLFLCRFPLSSTRKILKFTQVTANSADGFPKGCCVAAAPAHQK